MNWQGRWIWLSDELASSINLRVLVRKTFTLDAFDGAELCVTADSQYRLFINGQWINDGPTRAFPWRYSFDRVDIGRYLRPGKNVLAIQVQHYGEGTFHHLTTRPGLLAQLEITSGRSRRVIATDGSWKMMIDPAHERWTPRISCQMPHEEQYDAREELTGWREIDFNDSGWSKAGVVATVSDGPWKNLTEREIPLLAVERINPARIVSVRKVRAPNFVAGINVKRAFWPERTDANHRDYHGAILSGLVSSAAQEVQIFRQVVGINSAKVFINGKPVTYTGPEYVACGYLARTAAKVKLNKGMNVVLAIFDCRHHYDDFSLILDAPKPVHLKSPVGPGHWSVAGPFDQGGPDWEKLKTVRTIDQLKKHDLVRYFCEPPQIALLTGDANAQMMYHRAVDKPVKARGLENLLADNQDLAVIEPTPDDVELLIDLGKEYNAHVEFSLSAPEGVIVDAHCFEEIVGGVPKLACGNRSGFRYITRAGWQKFTTFRHFGFRYLALTLRNLTGPVMFRNLSALFVHHQVEHVGAFHSNDYLLNKIWTVGKQTLLCCMEDTFTDCPTYEQTYWVGDGRNEALICHTTFGQYDLTRRCVKLPGYSLKRSDLTESQVPSAWQNLLPAWSFLWVQMVWEHYQFSGDFKTLGEMYPCIVKMMNTIRQKYLEPKTGLFSIQAWNMFDWTNIDDNHKLVTHNNIFLVGALQVTERIARTLGKKTQAADWRRRARDLTSRINRFLWSSERNAYVDSIHDDGTVSTRVSRPANTLAVLYDVSPPDRAKKIMSIVMGEKTRDVVPFGSPFALFYLLECFVKLGRFDRLMDLVRREWGYMVDQGATTFWEMLRTTRSNCHAWSAAPTYFLSRYVLGVHPAEPGFRTIHFHPQLLDLRFAEGTVPTPAGPVNIRWEKSRSAFSMSIEKPATSAATFRLPDGLKLSALFINDRKVKYRPDLRLPRLEKNHIRAELI